MNVKKWRIDTFACVTLPQTIKIKNTRIVNNWHQRMSLAWTYVRILNADGQYDINKGLI